MNKNFTVSQVLKDVLQKEGITVKIIFYVQIWGEICWQAYKSQIIDTNYFLKNFQ